jgi:hypothetical protein
MGMEVVSIQMYTRPSLAQRYIPSATILVVYLLATFVGSSLYRKFRNDTGPENPATWASLGLLGHAASSAL